MTSYYNEIEPYAAQWLRNLIKAGLIPDGEVDTRSIVDVAPDDLRGFTQCHFFAGIGGWGHALRLAGWPDDRPIWTGSCPCQPFSVAGKGAGTDDPRHLWPHFHRLIAAVRPPVVMGEQVAGKAGYGWFDGVQSNLEGTGYSSRAADIPALAVNAPHIRQRLYWVALDVANASVIGREERERQDGQQNAGGGSQGRVDTAGAGADHMADTTLSGRGQRISNAGGMREGDGSQGPSGRPSQHGNAQPVHMANANVSAMRGRRGELPEKEGAKTGRSDNGSGCAGSFWDDHIWLTGADGKARRVEPSICLLAHGVSNRVGRLRAYGNAIVPQVAAEVIKAFMETQP